MSEEIQLQEAPHEADILRGALVQLKAENQALREACSVYVGVIASLAYAGGGSFKVKNATELEGQHIQIEIHPEVIDGQNHKHVLVNVIKPVGQVESAPENVEAQPAEQPAQEAVTA